MMGNMTVKLPRIRPYFKLQCFMLLDNHQYNCNITKSFLSVEEQAYMINIYPAFKIAGHSHT